MDCSRAWILAAAVGFTSLALGAAPQPGTTEQPEAAARTAPSPDSPLPTDSRVSAGSLESGLRYLVMRHDKPPGRAVVWLHVDSGSLNEKDDQRGIAHYLEHMAFNGSQNFAPGTVVEFFQNLGMTFGRHQNAFTNMDQTTYQLTLPDASVPTLDKAMLFLSDVALRLTLPEEEIQSERRIILEERRRGLSGERRANDFVMERIAPESIIGRRLTIGTEDTIAALKRPDFVDYYSRWYTPSNMTVLAVADAEPGAVIDAIRARFGEGKKVPKPADQDAGVTATRGVRAIVASDKELARATVEFVKVWPAPPPVITVGQWRQQLVRRLALQTFNRRMADKRALGKLQALELSARAGFSSRAMYQAALAAGGEPDSWRAILAELAAELQRARTHGFTAEEMAQTRAQVLASAKRSAQTERTRPAAVLIGLMNQSVTAGEPFMSASQEYELGSALLPAITDQEVATDFAALFDPSSAVFVVTLPTSAGEVTEAEVLEAGSKALSAVPGADEAPARAASLLEKLPEPGEVVESADHTGASVTSAWLANGARVHHRYMDYKVESVTVSILLAGGELLDTAATKGLARAGSVGWMQPATGTLSSGDIKNLLTGKSVTVVGRAESDALAITISAPAETIETGLQLAHLMLTDPRIEEAAFDQWKRRTLQTIDRANQDALGVAARLLPETVYPPGEVRPRLLTAQQVEALTIGAAEAWLRKAIAACPIEVSVVGDIEKEKALALVARYVGSLPARDRIGPGTFKELRMIPAPDGPRIARKEVPTQTPKAAVIAGFFGPDAGALREARLMHTAARVLSSRMVKEIREEKQLVYSISTASNPGTVYPGYGLVSAQATADPKNADALADVIDAMFGAFAKDGPTEEELGVVHKQLAKDVELNLLEPGFWSAELRDLTYRGQSLDDILGAPAEFAAFTGEEIREAFAKYHSAGPSVRVIVVPAPGT